MAIQLATRTDDPQAGALMERVIAYGDLAKLEPADRVAYYRLVCESLGLNWLTQPFLYLMLNNKLVLYATKGVTDQLRGRRHVNIEVVDRAQVGDMYVVTARATTPDGRRDEDIGAVDVAGLSGEKLANAYMKATTKAKRRVTLSIVGLGWLDESEVGSIAGARYVDVDMEGRIGRDRPALPEPDGAGDLPPCANDPDDNLPESVACSEPGCHRTVEAASRYDHDDKTLQGEFLIRESLRFFGRFLCIDHFAEVTRKAKAARKTRRG
jgi:hypothetical protein